jgi:hypothetical protein
MTPPPDTRPPDTRPPDTRHQPPLTQVVTAPASLGLPPRMRDLREVIRDEHVMRPRILAAVAEAPLSVPEIAAAIGQPQREVVFWVMGLRKYGYLSEVKPDDDEDDGYFRYRPVDTEGQG